MIVPKDRKGLIVECVSEVIQTDLPIHAMFGFAIELAFFGLGNFNHALDTYLLLTCVSARMV